jgi:hypothetical protein
MLYGVFVNICEHAVRVCNLDQILMCAFMTYTVTGILMNMWCWCSLPLLTPRWPRTQFLRCWTEMQISAPTVRRRNEPPRRPADRQLKKNVTYYTYIAYHQNQGVPWETISVCGSSGLVFSVRQTGSIVTLYDKVTVGILHKFCGEECNGKINNQTQRDWKDQRKCGHCCFLDTKNVRIIYSTVLAKKLMVDLLVKKLVPMNLDDFYVLSQNFEKRLLTSSCLSVCLSVRIEQIESHRWDCNDIL